MEKKTMTVFLKGKIKGKVVLIMLAAFLGTIAASSFLGQWSMSSEEGVSGDSLLIEVAEKYQIPLEEIYEYWKIPREISPHSSVADARVIAGFSTGAFKAWVAMRTPREELKKAEEANHVESMVEIRGALTLRQISDTYNIPLDAIYEKWKFSKLVSPDTSLKELKDGYGFSMEDFKAWVASERKK